MAQRFELPPIDAPLLGDELDEAPTPDVLPPALPELLLRLPAADGSWLELVATSLPALLLAPLERPRLPEPEGMPRLPAPGSPDVLAPPVSPAPDEPDRAPEPSPDELTSLGGDPGVTEGFALLTSELTLRPEVASLREPRCSPQPVSRPASTSSVKVVADRVVMLNLAGAIAAHDQRRRRAMASAPQGRDLPHRRHSAPMRNRSIDQPPPLGVVLPLVPEEVLPPLVLLGPVADPVPEVPLPLMSPVALPLELMSPEVDPIEPELVSPAAEEPAAAEGSLVVPDVPLAVSP